MIGSNSFSNVYKWGWTRPWQVCQGIKLVSTFQFGSGLTTKSWLHCTTYLVLFQFYSANQIACQTGLGTLLYHTQVSWIVLSLMHSENIYTTHKLQFPTLKCANSTQQQPFTHVFNTADLDVTGHRWQVLNLIFFSGLKTGKTMMMKTVYQDKTVIPRPFHLTSKSTARFVNLTPRFTWWKDLILHALCKERAISQSHLAGFSFIYFFLESAGVYKAKLDFFNKDWHHILQNWKWEIAFWLEK